MAGHRERWRLNWALARRPHDTLLELYRRIGPVHAVGPYVYLLGPEANRFVLEDSERFRWRPAFDALRVVDGDTALIVSDGPDHRRRRRLVTPAFTRRRIDGYADTFRRAVDVAIDGWSPGRTLDLYAELRRVIRRGTIEVLFGPGLAADEPALGRLLQPALDAVERPPPLQQLQRLGTPGWRRARAGRAAVARRVAEEVARCRAAGAGDRTDVLTRLVAARDEDGSTLTDVEVVDQVISLIAAGYETTSAAMAWLAHAALTDAELWDPGLAEPAPGWRRLDGVVAEVLRLHPPAVISARSSAVALEFAGRRIPAGRLLLFSPYLTHRLPELWPDPLRLHPDRWDPDAAGYRKPAPSEYLPFGGGPHRCLGAAFAVTELTVLLEQLLRRTRLELVDADITPVGLAAMRPRRGPIARVVSVN